MSSNWVSLVIEIDPVGGKYSLSRPTCQTPTNMSANHTYGFTYRGYVAMTILRLTCKAPETVYLPLLWQARDEATAIIKAFIDEGFELLSFLDDPTFAHRDAPRHEVDDTPRLIALQVGDALWLSDPADFVVGESYIVDRGGRHDYRYVRCVGVDTWRNGTVVHPRYTFEDLDEEARVDR